MTDTPEITPTTDAEAAMLGMIEQLTDELAATREELAALSNDNQRLADRPSDALQIPVQLSFHDNEQELLNN